MSLISPTQSRLHRGYQQTEVGTIPEDWTIRTLLSCLRSAPDYGINAAATPFDDALPTYLRITDIGEDNQFRPSPRVSVRHPRSPAYFLSKGDLVFARTGASVGKSYLYNPDDGPLVFAGYLIRVRPKPGELLPSFLAYCVQSKRYWNWVATVSIRSGQPGINGQEYGKFRLPLPAPAEQCAIATALSDADALIGGLEQLIAKKRDLKQAVMHQLLTGQARLPGFRGEWEVKRLGDHVAFLRNGTSSRAELTQHDPVKYLHYGDVHACVGAQICPDELPSIPSEKAKFLSRLQDGDLVFADASEDLAGVSRSVEMHGVADTETVPGLHTIAARFDKSALADGFKSYLQFCPPFSGQLRQLATGTKVYATSRAHIASIEMRLPGVEEQAAIAAVLSDMDAELAELEARRAKTRDLKQGMMQELLTGRIRLI